MQKIYSQLLLAAMTSLILGMGVITSNMGRGAYAQQVVLNGAGSTFIFPLMDTWRVEYQKVKPEVSINYQSIGSGGGVKQFMAKTVDFGASDAPLTAQEEKQASGAVHIPVTIGSVVPAYNIPSIPEKGLKFSGPVLADIFLGKIKKWNDPKIAALNPDKTLPGDDIVVVHRSDGSGTTYVWTDYLSTVSPEWNQTVGKGKSVPWQTGIGAPGNEGVANSVKGSPNTIGYVELAYAVTTGMPVGFVQNKAGKFIEPTLESTEAAVAASATKFPNGDQSWSNITLVDAPGDNSYPIASFVYVFLFKDMSTDPNLTAQTAKAMVDFLSWSITDGQKIAPELAYVPLPDNVVKLDQETLKSLTFKGSPIA